MSSKEKEQNDVLQIRLEVGYGSESQVLIKEENEDDEFTRFFFDKVLKEWQYKALLLTLFVIIGTNQGYQANIILQLQESGATYSEQAIFVLALLPYGLKIMQSPFIDLYNYPRFGKCKTWIVISSLAISITLFIYSVFADLKVSPENVVLLAIIWAFINTVLIFLQISGELWITKIFTSDDDKSSGGGLMTLGQQFGIFLGLNVLVPLSDKNWLNSHIFTDNPLSRPIITDREFIASISCFTLLFGIFVGLFVAERIPKKESKGIKTFKQFYSLLPKFFIQKNMRKLLLYISLLKFFQSMVEETTILKFLDEGIKKSYIVNVATLIFPVHAIGVIVAMRLVTKSILIRTYHIFHAYTCLYYLLMYLAYLDLHLNHNFARTKILLIVLEIINKLQVSGYMCIGYANSITSPETGSIFITFLMSWGNLNSTLPNALGLRIAGIEGVNYNAIVLFCLGIQFTLDFFTFRVAREMDTKTKAE